MGHPPTKQQEGFSRKGEEWFERRVRPLAKPGEEEKVVAIDVETGEFEIDDDELVAYRRLAARLPNPQVWYRRMGSRYLYRFGHWRGTAPQRSKESSIGAARPSSRFA